MNMAYDSCYGDYYGNNEKIVDIDKFFSHGMSEPAIIISNLLGFRISQYYDLTGENYKWLYYNVTPELIESCIDNNMLRTTKQIIASYEYVTNSYCEPEKTIADFWDDACSLVKKCKNSVYITASKDEPFYIGELFILPCNNTCNNYVETYKMASKFTEYKLKCLIHYLQEEYAWLNPYSYSTYSKAITSAMLMLDVNNE